LEPTCNAQIAAETRNRCAEPKLFACLQRKGHARADYSMSGFDLESPARHHTTDVMLGAKSRASQADFQRAAIRIITHETIADRQREPVGRAAYGHTEAACPGPTEINE
jgi:hypothetical protein